MQEITRKDLEGKLVVPYSVQYGICDVIVIYTDTSETIPDVKYLIVDYTPERQIIKENGLDVINQL